MLARLLQRKHETIVLPKWSLWQVAPWSAQVLNAKAAQRIETSFCFQEITKTLRGRTEAPFRRIAKTVQMMNMPGQHRSGMMSVMNRNHRSFRRDAMEDE